jgi:TPP-dependent pyruvate/acetoin dehydrogenase alpha subunit
MFDPELYRSREEVLKWKEKDPIQFLKDHMEKDYLTETVLKDLEKNVEEEMLEAVSFAEHSTVEPIEDLEKYLYENDLS